MKRYLFLKASLVLVMTLSVGITIWVLIHKKAPPQSFSSEQKHYRSPMRITGLDGSTFYGDKLFTRVRADEFKISPRKFFIFNIKPFNEVVLTNAILEVHLYPEMPGGVGLFSLADNILSAKDAKTTLKGMGVLTRGMINGFILEVFKADRPCLLVEAKKVYIDFKRKKTNLIDASIKEILSQKLIISKSIIWSEKEKIFKIPGPYFTLTGRGRANGKGIKVDLNFVVSPLT
ncbi:MAG: hypothetical protein JRI37_14425 [Deltaproteobacteria bacterium]|nr:hypothetical protein [Deltaproteobacteria bacterium]